MALRNHRKCFITDASPVDKAPTRMMPLPSEPLLCQGLGAVCIALSRTPALGPSFQALGGEQAPNNARGNVPSGEQAVQGPQESEGREDILHESFSPGLTTCHLLSPVELLHANRDHGRGNVIPGRLSAPAESPMLPSGLLSIFPRSVHTSKKVTRKQKRTPKNKKQNRKTSAKAEIETDH